eukprot:1674369-Rhodomonas_salina.2
MLYPPLSYAPSMKCPVLRSTRAPMALRTPYGESSTESAVLVLLPGSSTEPGAREREPKRFAIRLRACFAMSGTAKVFAAETVYGAVLLCAMSGTEVAYGVRCPVLRSRMLLLSCCAVSGTEIAYAARYLVLRKRNV